MIDKFDLEVYNCLCQLAIPAHVRGYQYIKSAMHFLHENPQSIRAITKELYPGTAAMYEDVKPQHVERGIRHAISLSKADDATWYRIMGRIGPLANGEFLATMDEAIKIKLAVEEEEKQ